MTTFLNTGQYTHPGLVVNQLLEDLVDLAAVALAETPMGTPQSVGLWHSEPVEDCCDTLYLWVREWVPVNGRAGFPNQIGGVDRCHDVIFHPRVVLSLSRPCSPTPDESGTVDPAEEHAIASELVVDAQALFCGVSRLWLPRLRETFPHSRIFYGPATSTGQGTACPGLDWTMLLEFDTCKSDCGG